MTLCSAGALSNLSLVKVSMEWSPTIESNKSFLLLFRLQILGGDGHTVVNLAYDVQLGFDFNQSLMSLILWSS